MTVSETRMSRARYTEFRTLPTYIKTYEGFLYLAVVIDLYSRRVIGWARNHGNQLTLSCKRC